MLLYGLTPRRRGSRSTQIIANSYAADLAAGILLFLDHWLRVRVRSHLIAAAYLVCVAEW